VRLPRKCGRGRHLNVIRSKKTFSSNPGKGISETGVRLFTDLLLVVKKLICEHRNRWLTELTTQGPATPPCSEFLHRAVPLPAAVRAVEDYLLTTHKPLVQLVEKAEFVR
jgi:hypothetical protein